MYMLIVWKQEKFLNPLAELSQRILDSANGLVVFVVNVL